MISFILLIHVVFLQEGQEVVYEYVNYTALGETHKVVFNKNKKTIESSGSISKVNYKDCSTNDFRCLKVSDEVFYVPKNIEISGEFESPYGKYIIYNNKGELPFNVDIDYKLIKLVQTGKADLVIFYNSEKGIIAILDQANKEDYQISWLVGNCGLLSSKTCN